MVRTKQTGKPKPQANGMPKAPAENEKAVKSQNQPTELSEGDRTKIKNWLDKQDKPFGLFVAPLSKKRKRNAGMQTQTDLFEERLSLQYEVRPKDKWECLRRYKKFTGSCQ